jgi:hypothetical protein
MQRAGFDGYTTPMATRNIEYFSSPQQDLHSSRALPRLLRTLSYPRPSHSRPAERMETDIS